MSGQQPGRFDLSPQKRALLERLRQQPPGADVSRIPRRASTGPAPLSFAQQRLWFLHQLDPESPAYNLSGAVRLEGSLDVRALGRALEAIVARHESLRTSFPIVDGHPVQLASAAAEVPLPLEDLRCLPEIERETEARRLAAEEARRPFALDRGPLLRVTLLKLAEDDHVLLLTLHHIVSDGWSRGIFTRELALFYRGFQADEALRLAELPIQYSDFAAWQRERLQGEHLQGQLDYWREQLEGLEPLRLPADRPRPLAPGGPGASVLRVLPAHLVDALRALGQEEGATLFMSTLAVFQALLYRTTAREDIAVGSPIANRNRPEVEGLIGYFVNNLVLRARFSPGLTFREFLAQVRVSALGAFDHQDLPFEKLVDELKPDRELGRNPLFDVVFVHRGTPSEGVELPGLLLRPLEAEVTTARFDLEMHLQETASGLAVAMVYRADCFERSTIERLLEGYETLLEGAVARPDARLLELPLLTDEQRRLLVAEWGRTGREYATHELVQELFEAQADRAPQATAVSMGSTRLTYLELEQRSNQLAHRLRTLGVGPEVRVGVCTERSPEMVVAILGVLKAGGAYVPMDPEYPKAQLSYLLADAGMRVVLTQERLLPRLPEAVVGVLCVDREEEGLERESVSRPKAALRSENLAYVIYTSGSTGRPKGVEVPHRGLMSLVRWHQHAYAVEATDRATQLAGPAFDASVWEIWPYLTAGASLHFAATETRLSPEKLVVWLREQGITISFMPTPLAERVLREKEGLHGLSLRVLLTGGDKLHALSGDPLPFRLMNHYGPTECSVVATGAEVDPTSAGEPPIGRPIDNTQVYVLDQAQNLCPVGAPGELYIGGAGVARGYLDRPDLTADRFVPDPLGGGTGARLYRTGDLVRYRGDGQLEFLGRIDHQVKIRGFRVELGEVEAALGRHPEVKESVVVARAEGGTGQRLVAYVVPARGAGAVVQLVPRLRGHLEQALPGHMVPAAIVVLESLPLTPNGKVDRRALPASSDRPELEEGYVEPRSPVEEAVSAVWRDVLGVERVGVHDDFFDLGGHSLMATQVVSRLRDTFRVELPVRALFEAPTVSALAERLEEARRPGGAEVAPPIRPVSRAGDLPLSFAQQRLWFLDQMGAGAAYNIPWALRLRGVLDVGALRSSLSELLRRHEVLRTTFPAVGGRALQVVGPPVEVVIEETDLSGLPEVEGEREARRLANEEAGRPFDLARGPVVRTALLRFGSSDHVLLVTIHHIVADGWSMGVLTRELAAHYRRAVEGGGAGLPELPVQYADFAHWQRQWLQGEVLERQLGYWRQHLGGEIPRLELPTDRPRPTVQTYRGGTHVVSFPHQLADGLAALCRREGATQFMVLLAGFKALLHRLTGLEDIAVGAPIANRNRRELEGLIGFFVNSLVMRTDLSGNPSFRELLGRVREAALGAYDHQDLPFEKLVEEMHPGRDLGQNPIFQVIFAVQNASLPALELKGLQLEPFAREEASTRFDLEVHVFSQGGESMALLRYNADLFDAATVDQLGRHWLALLEGAVARPEARIGALPLLRGEEQVQVLALGRGRPTEYPRESSLSELFEAQVVRTPDAEAVVFGERRLKYSDLDVRSTRLARYLRALGVGTETRVGICVERSAEMVVGLLAIVKAGGAYVPLDPSYPKERLALMLADSGVKVLLTQELLLGVLPEYEAKVLCLDRDAGDWGEESGESLGRQAGGDNLAYVIYTSGSTGLPKGVAVTHRAVGRLVLNTDYVRVEPADRIAQASNASFDAATFEIWGALLNGACLVGISREIALSPRELGAALRREGVTTLFLTTALFGAVSREEPAAFAGLTHLLFGGEAVDPASVRQVLARGRPKRLLHVYGPTETTTYASWHLVEEVPEEATTVPIGRPIANTSLRVLSAVLEPVPVGVPGELFIGGDGLARGYLGHPALTAEKFVPNPFASTEGDRLYRTGDRVRWRSDGAIEFLGRTDDQVKIRGFRIELGEIQSVLSGQEGVSEAVVLVREGELASEKRLVAYVVPKPVGHEAALEEETEEGREGRVAQWRKVYESVIYDRVEEASPSDPTFNLSGWNSTYTGLPIPAAEMREQVEQVVERILSGHPRRVLEIGCGTGLLLSRIAPHCERYVATDFSTTALEYVRGALPTISGLRAEIELWERRADDFSGIEQGGYDAVVLNSVVQYFPDVDYLRRVLEGAVKALAPGGRLFVGDVRHLTLLETFVASVQKYQTPADVSRARLAERVKEHLAQEQELVVDPRFFVAFAQERGGIGQVHVTPRRGRASNELTKYRYDAFLEVGPRPEEKSVVWLDWEEDELSLFELRRLLAETGPLALGVKRVPNARVRADVLGMKWLSGAEGSSAPASGEEGSRPEGVDPEALWSLSSELPYEVDLSWAASHAEGRYDLLLRRRFEGSRELPVFPVVDLGDRGWSEYTNDPLRATQVRALVPQMRRYLQERLPEYMVPSAFVLLESMPLTPNGKVDARALLAKEVARGEVEEVFEGPRTPVEEELSRIWAQVLGVSRVGIRDNFFELGGDSILSIQIIARANQAGLRLTPKQIFQAQTIAELALVVGTSEVVEAEQGLVRGSVPLTPIQSWFFEQELEEVHHFNQAVLLEVRRELSPEVVGEAVKALEAHHDALRLRFEKTGLGWRQEVTLPGASAFGRVDLTAVASGEERSVVERVAADAQKSLSLEGPLWRVVWMDLGGGRGSRLLVVIHHLAVDGVSWRVLLEDLERVCGQLGRGEPVRLPAKTMSFKEWSEKLRTYAESDELKAQLSHWRGVHAEGSKLLPVDGVRDEGTVEDTGTVTALLEVEETRALLQEVPGAYHSQVTDVLLVALARSLAEWTGERSLLLDLEGHGREEVFEGVDVSRTVGWFTSLFPTRVTLSGEGGIGEDLKVVKEQLRAVPERGLGYGVLRYLGGEEGRSLAASRGAELSFNYLGRFEQGRGEDGLFGSAKESAGESRSPKAKRRYLIEISGGVTNGRLSLTWIYSRKAHRSQTIEGLVARFERELRGVIVHCLSEGAGGHTPSDFPLARIDQTTLDRVLGGERDLEDVYPLSPMQEGMLFHCLLDPESAVYLEQLSIELRGDLDAPSLARAWQQVVDRHTVFRTRFVWEGLSRPVQVVHRKATLDWEECDLRGLHEKEKGEAFERLLAQDRKRGLDPSQAPLTRVLLVRTGEDTHRLVWDFHHLSLDGWCLPIVLKEVSAAYEALRSGRRSELPAVPSYRGYIAWLQEQDLEQAERYWRHYLAGLGSSTPLPLDRVPGRSRDGSLEMEVHAFQVSGPVTAALKALSRQHRLTLNTIVQGAWALLLGRYSGKSDVVFGATVSGRPAGLPGVESMVGLFINTLPLRVRLSPEKSLLAWLEELQAQQVEQRQYEFSPLVKVQGWSEVPPGQLLFESILGFENYPAGSSVGSLGTIGEVRHHGRTNYPLTITAAPRLALTLRIAYDRRRFDGKAILRVGTYLTEILEAIARDANRALFELPGLPLGEEEFLVRCNEAEREYPRESSLGELFEAQALRTPDAEAVVFGEERLTYSELDLRSNRLARHLRTAGVGTETRVGICVERSAGMVVGLLGILKAGGAYVPLDPSYPKERLALMLADSGISVLLTQESLLGALPEHEAKVLCLDRDGAQWAQEGAESLGRQAGGDNLAYVIYTSGSTGLPKGVAVPHRGVSRLVLNTDYVRTLPGDRIAQASNASFDAATFEIWGALLNGACLVGISREAALSPRELGEALRRERVTTLFLTTALFGAVSREEPSAFAGLTHLLFGGEAVDPASVRHVLAAGRPKRLLHVYGPTETTTYATWQLVEDVEEEATTVPIGGPIANTSLHVLGAGMERVPVGAPGELFIGGDGLARGYLGHPDLTAEKFVPDPFASEPGRRLYRSGDLVRRRADGTIEFLGRRDHQVKVRGFRVEPGEIESVLTQHPAVREVLVMVREDVPGDKRLVGYLVLESPAAVSLADLKHHLDERLPEHMVPSAFVLLDRLPLNPNGKVDRRALPAPHGRPELEEQYVEPRSEVERRVAAVWQEVLGLDRVGSRDNFFDLGGHSLLLLQVHSRLRSDYARQDLKVVDLFQYPTVEALAKRLSGEAGSTGTVAAVSQAAAPLAWPEAIAVVAMAGRFPGARSVEELWKNLREGVESVSFFTDEELLETGVPKEILGDERYVRARGVLEGAELFDAGFFGYGPREAQVIDPQQRVFLETAWEALERAGCDPERYPGAIGVYAGVAVNRYQWLVNADAEVAASVGGLGVLVASDKDFLPTRVSYKLNLTGPSVNVQTACSTSLVAVHVACQGLLQRECDLALAGGVAIGVPQKAPYRYEEDSILSPDGHCRAFDAKAQGTVAGSGVGVVVLKRLADALRDGDRIEAVIKGSAINNDGSQKVGYTAPGVAGQAKVVALAQARAGVAPETIGYVEAHGTGTALGDPVEIEALNQAFGGKARAPRSCAIGSLKTNVGHLDAAAGVAGLIKAVLALRHREIPPSLHFEAENPRIPFSGGPFYVNDCLKPWTAGAGPRRAGVSSFGLGGTNAHVVLEEAPAREPAQTAPPWHLLTLSAKGALALDEASARLRDHLREHPEQEIADVAHTLQNGRRSFPHRRAVVCADEADARAVLSSADPKRIFDGVAGAALANEVAFLFPGQGSQHLGMGAGLYGRYQVYRDEVDRCLKHLKEELNLDLRQVLLERPPAGDLGPGLAGTALAQPALFVCEWALAKLWQALGIEPTAMLGHSVGEYVAACVAGVFSLEEGLRLVAVRGRLMGGLPAGAMSAVMLGEDEVQRWLGPRISLAAVNAPRQCVVSGETEAISDLERRLLAEDVECHRLRTSHAFHSAMMDPVLRPFEEELRRLRLRAPRIPYLSNLTGTWIREEEATAPSYWVRHLRETVRFSSGLHELLGRAKAVLEVGPGQALSSLARAQAGQGGRHLIVSSSRHPGDDRPDEEVLLTAVGRLWTAGAEPVWSGLHRGERRQGVLLPTYPFQRQRYWVEATPVPAPSARNPLAKADDVADWFYVPAWKQALAPAAEGVAGEKPARVLLLADNRGLAAELRRRLLERGHDVTTVTAGEGYAHAGEHEYRVDPRREEGYRSVLEDLGARGTLPQSVVHLWSLIPEVSEGTSSPEVLDLGFYSVVSLAKALDATTSGTEVRLTVVTTGAQDVTGDETLVPEQAVVLGACRVIPQDLPGLRCRAIDVDRPARGSWPGRLVEALVGETTGDGRDLTVAYRHGRRWVQTWERAPLPAGGPRPARVREQGVYLITGGLGAVGLELARCLAETVKARLVLVSRTAIPAATEWKRLAGRGGSDVETLRFRQLQGLLDAGAEVVTVQADVADEGQMRAVIGRTLDQFGILHGVLHSAGPDKRPSPVPEIDREHCERQFRPRLQGLRVLEKVLRGLPLDFCMLQSSLGSILGVVGFAAYSAAHAFQDAFAARQSRLGGVPWLAVNWDNWEAWVQGGVRPAGVDFIMSASEGRDAFARLLGFDGAAQVAVSTCDLPARMDRWLGLSFLGKAEKAPVTTARHARPDIGTTYVAPRTQAEQALASIWASLLGVDKVGALDNFFELGGDSVISIQMVARSAQAGLRLTAKQVFESPTVAGLAAVAGRKAAATAQGPVLGPLPLTPIQSWFFEQEHPRRDHFNHALLFSVDRVLDPEALERAARALVLHHDGLRLRFRRGASGWEQWCEAPGDEAVSSRIDLTGLATGEAARAIESASADLQTSLDLEHGPTFRLAYFDLGPERAGRLLLLAHHLVVDAVSWRLLLDDLRVAYEQVAAGRAPSLPAKTTSYKEWSEGLRALAQATEMAQDLEHWRSRPWRDAVALPLDHSAGANVASSVRRVVAMLGREETRALLQEVPRRHDVQVQEVLAYALATTLGAWSGTRAPLFHIEGHGREGGQDGLDVSRTVGWFTALVPAIVTLEPESSPLVGLRAVQEQLRALPRRGIGFGMLRHLSEDGSLRAELAALPRPQVSFLYHGAVDHVLSPGGWLAPAAESAGALDDPRALRGHVLDVSGAVAGEELSVVWLYSENLHRKETIETLAAGFLEALRGVVSAAQASPKADYAPSDFPAARLDRRGLDTLVSALRRSSGS